MVQINGAAVSGILETADRLKADYIVMGSHGHTALYDLLVGSTTHACLNVPPARCSSCRPAKKKGAKEKTLRPDSLLDACR